MNRDHVTQRAAVRAVDVGYFNVKYTLGRKRQGDSAPIAVEMFPSLAPRLASANRLEAPGGHKTDGCVVVVDEVPYFVGKDVVFNMSGSEPRPVVEDYCLSSRYMALLRGAMHYMLVDAGDPVQLEIGHLVLGLPLTTWGAQRVALAQRAQGEHVISCADGARTVLVERVHVIPQPHGSLLNFASTCSADGWTLVVDVGGGTLDWYVGSRGNVNLKRSGSHPKAMLACATVVAEAVDKSWVNQFEVMGRIDTAIRERKATFRAQGQDVPLAPHRKAIEAVMEESLDQMLTTVGRAADIERILITGGGASAFGEFMVRKNPHLAKLVHVDLDPVYANVRGFQTYGEMQQAKSEVVHGGAR